MTYSVDFREKVLSVKAREKLSFSAVAERFDVGIASVVRWSKKLCPQRHRNKLPTKISDDSLLQDVAQYPGGYHHERAQRLGCSKSGIGVALKRLNITYKKNANPSQSKTRRKKALRGKNSKL